MRRCTGTCMRYVDQLSRERESALRGVQHSDATAIAVTRYGYLTPDVGRTEPIQPVTPQHSRRGGRRQSLIAGCWHLDCCERNAACSLVAKCAYDPKWVAVAAAAAACGSRRW
mmetsp:Transcript_31263/g.58293  ORF Transcript_31263/g.58293 Transcript_31263/m.58293 type:complete len:113 (+) Transcript_31263:136-474(+)